MHLKKKVFFEKRDFKAQFTILHNATWQVVFPQNWKVQKL